MTEYLLDTQIIIVAMETPERLPQEIRSAIQRGPNIIGVTSYWEVMLKSMKGNLDVGDPRIWWAQTLDSLSAKPLHVLPAHISRLHELPPIHADPFDRILIAQAMSEGLTLLTTDKAILKYAPNRFPVLH